MNVAVSSELTTADVGSFTDRVADWFADFAPTTWDGPAARDAVVVFSRLARLADAVTAVAGRRVDETTAWSDTGDRTASAFLARMRGTSTGQAASALAAAKDLDHLAATNERFRHGDLSTEQAAAIATGAKACPEAEQMLLEDAATKPVAALKAKARELEARADHSDDQHARRRAKRHFRRFNGDDCMRNYLGELPPDMAGELESVWDVFTARVFRNARAEGRRESHAAYMADGLLAMARAANARLHPTTDTGDNGDEDSDFAEGTLFDDPDPSTDVPTATGHGDIDGPVRANFVIRVDIGPLLRGQVLPGEVCEIAGIGPIDIATARKLMSNAVLDFVISDGIDIRTVAHAGRKPPDSNSLRCSHYVCEIEGCETRENLEIDHIDPYAESHRTCVHKLGYKCAHCHHLKTHKGWTDGPLQANGRRKLIPPPTPPPKND